MEIHNLETLKSIKKVEISDAVFEKISSRIQNSKTQTIPLYKVGIAASLLFGFMLFEIFWVNQKFKEKATQKIELVIVNNNHLYDE